VKILVVGDGGREHAIAWKLLQSSRVTGVFCAPGNGGTAMLAKCCNVPLLSDDFEGLYRFVLTNAIRLVVVGSEVPLAKGITDYFSQYGVLVFGPSQLGAQIEASKTWAKTLMEEAGIPTGRWASFTDTESAYTYVEQQTTPIVVKVDGLAAGKGVTVAMTVEEAQSAIAAGFDGQFGDAGQRLIIEEYLTGREISVLALTDGTTICPLIPVQDHKRIGENDTGANTGGMGVYGPIPWVTAELMRRIQQDILEPAIAQLKQRDIIYRGVLYAGLMITPDGEPKVIEFNCRFGIRKPKWFYLS
jgi:phosphoribosylamine--glycine ligase